MRADRKGFTLVELLLSVSILGIIAGFTTPLYIGFQNRNQLAVFSDTVVGALRKAQYYAIHKSNNSQWGVAVGGGSVTVFAGESYALRDQSLDEVHPIPATITASGLNAVVFTKGTGEPSVTGVLTLESVGYTRTITVDPKGVIGR